MNSVLLSMFWERDPDELGSNEFDRVDVTVDDNGIGTVKLSPHVNVSSGKGKPVTRKAMSIRVEAGDVLTARGRSYKVLNVVPTREIKGVGRLVGWIEISADPVRATEGD